MESEAGGIAPAIVGGDRRRRALFLSGSLGRGHDALAEGCAAVLDGAGVESRIVDCLGLMGQRSGRAGTWMFRRLVASALYDAFHFGQLERGGWFGGWAERSATRRIYPRLLDELDDFTPDVAIVVFATGVAPACRLKRDRRCQLVVVFLPDSVAHRLWIHEDVDLFLVTSPLGAASVRRYRPEAAIRVVDAPVAPEFRSPPSQAAARALIGVPDEAPCVLLMAGAWGFGPLDEIAVSLGRAGYWVLAAAGTNAALVAKLQAAAQRYPTIRPLAFTRQVPELISASDVVVTTSGWTCSEVRAVGRDLILLDVIPGHGRENLLHQLEMGHAAVAAATPEGVTRAVQAYFADPEPWGHRPRPPRFGGDQFASALADIGFDPGRAGIVSGPDAERQQQPIGVASPRPPQRQHRPPVATAPRTR
jgi:processive 1,2-diacylglycerol beta-glucosyltransferase